LYGKKIINSNSNQTPWLIKRQFIIERISLLIENKGRKIIMLNVEAQIDPNKQFKKYKEVCEISKDKFEVVVTTNLLREERILWPNQDVQFYIKERSDKINSTGNYNPIQKIINT